MKKLFILFLLPLVSFAQSSDGFSYSAIVRDAQGAVLPNTTVGIEVTVLAYSTSGSAVYSETHNALTDGYGVVALIVGNGTVQSGSLSGIDWGASNHYLEVGIDLSGGSNYAVLSTTQIMSVPYALHARNADTASYVSASQSSEHYIGEFFQGGVIFHLWEDSTGQHGLIVSPVIVDSGQVWSNVTSASGATSYLDGKANTQAIISQSGHTTSAAQSCVNYNGGGYTDWYLPALEEAKHINESRYSINRTLALDSNYTQLGTRGTLNYREEKIMTSTQSGVYYQYFRFGLDIWDSGISVAGKTQAQYENYIRAVRSF